MSRAPKIGGRLREETSGADRSQAVSAWWGSDPVKEIGQTCELDVIMRRQATSDRSVVTAVELVCSTWKFTPPGERHGKALYRNRLASQPVHLLPAVGKRTDVCDPVGAGEASAVCGEAAGDRRGGRGDHVQHEAVLRRGGAARGARAGARHQPVSGHQRVGEEDRSQRCAAVVAVSVEGTAAGGAHEG